MSCTNDELRTLRKEIQRLGEALVRAQHLNAGLQKDKDYAWKLLQFMVGKQGGHFTVVRAQLERYDPRQQALATTLDMHGNLHLQLTGPGDAAKRLIEGD